MSIIDKRKNKKEYVPGINATRIVRQKKQQSNLKCSEDTIIRIEIQGIISSYLKEGKEKEYIVNILSSNSRYEKYAMYFENWIEDKIKKVARKEEKEK